MYFIVKKVWLCKKILYVCIMRNEKTIWYFLQKEIFFWIDKLFLSAISVAFVGFLLWFGLKYEVMNLLWSILFSVD